MKFGRAALLSALLAACGSASDAGASGQSGAMSDEAFEAKLREVLLENPEIIVEAIEAYRAQFEAEAAEAAREATRLVLPDLIEGENGHAVGASLSSAELVIVEFFDYHCGFCQRALDDVLARIEADDRLRVVFYELPILREESEGAARAAIAAGKLGSDAYLSLHAALMRAPGVLDGQAITKAAKTAGVSARDLAKAQETHAGEIEAKLDASLSLARNLAINGTPFFVVYNPKTDEFEVVDGYRQELLAGAIERIGS